MSLKLEDVTYTYSPGTAYEMHALEHINLEIPNGQFVGIIGHTGSGKSTLVQHLNGLIRPTLGRVLYNGEDIWKEGYPLRELRSHVGLVFQYPEHQLFETDVITDVCFGPKNQGLSPEECRKRAEEALDHVGFPKEMYEKSPFELSGGQKRRVAIAGVLAMNPDFLVLDEPTAGLDPKGRDEILDQLALLHKTRGISVVLVSHSMEDIAKYAERLIVVNDGEIAYDDAPKAVFAHYRELEAMGLAAPQIGLPIRVVVIDLDVLSEDMPEYKDFRKAYINAHILEVSGEEVSMDEGCLSLPGIHESVKRGNKIRVQYLDENLEPHDEIIEGYLARVMQHEFDHLEGKMFIDHLSPLRKQMIKGKLNAMLKGKAHCTYKVKTVKK